MCSSREYLLSHGARGYCKFRGEGKVQKEAISKMMEGWLLKVFFPAAPSKIAE